MGGGGEELVLSGCKAVYFPTLLHLKSLRLCEELARFLMYVADPVLNELTLYISTFFYHDTPSC